MKFILFFTILSHFLLISCNETHINLSLEEQNWLNENRTAIRMQFDSFFPPIEYADSNDARFSGMSADLIHIIERKLNISILKSGASDWEASLRDLESGECWFLPAIVKTTERSEYTLFTTPYITIPLVIFGRNRGSPVKSISALRNTELAVVASYASETFVREQISDDVSVKTFPDVESMVKAVSFGEVEYCVGNLAVVSYEINRLKLTNLKVLGDLAYTYPLSIGVSRKYPLLHSIMEKSLNDISEEEYRQLEQKWILGITKENNSRVLILIISLSILAVTLLILLLYRLSNRLKRTSKDLVKADSTLLMISSQFPDTLFYNLEVNRKTGERRFISVNESIQKLHGITAQDALTDASLLYSQVHPDFQKALAEAEDIAFRNKSLLRQEIQFILPDNSRRWGIISSIPIDSRGEILLWNGIETDITDQKKAAEKESRLREQLHQAQKMEAVGQLAGGIAHDFNNVLAAISGMTEFLLTDKTLNEKQTEVLRLIMVSTRRASELTQKLLTFSRQGALSPSPLDCLNIVKETVAILKRTINKSIDITVTDNTTSTAIIGDETLLQNAFLNMGINASHAMPHGGKLNFTLENLELDETYCKSSSFDIKPGHYLKISVRDTGTGIPLEIQNRIFEPFFTTKEEKKGSGLGLATVFGAIQEHKGAIIVYSEPDKGTVFHVYLPITTEQPAHIPSEQAIPHGSGTVLVIDDEELIRTVTKAFLSTIGYKVLLAENGAEGIKVFQEAEDRVDLIILDMIMPVMGGHETFEQLRKLKPDLPIIISSGFARDEQIADLKQKEISAFLKKPFHLAELAQIINEVLPPKGNRSAG